jgi:hypothetical protein
MKTTERRQFMKETGAVATGAVLENTMIMKRAIQRKV